MLILTAPSKHKEKACCGNCKSGKPCCGSKPKPRPSFFRARSGLWLPRRGLELPKALLRGGYPSEAEWAGLWRPWQPALMPQTFDMSCLPCCQGATCAECDPCLDDAGYPGSCDDLSSEFTGGITGSATLIRDNCLQGDWSYGRTPYPLTDGCGDGTWTSLDEVCVYCDGDRIWASFGAAAAGCHTQTGPIEADEWTCDPFTASFSLTTEEDTPGDCPCGAGVAITFTVSE